MDVLITIAAALVFLYWSYCLLRWVYETTTTLMVRLWRRLDPRHEAHLRRQYERIVRDAKLQQRALSDVYTEEMKAISDAAAKRIINRRKS